MMNRAKKSCSRCYRVDCKCKIDNRPSYSDRYGHRREWQLLRDSHLADYPLCHDCQSEGIIREATEAHHPIKHYGNVELMLDPTNLLSLCHNHHSIRTQKGE